MTKLRKAPFVAQQGNNYHDELFIIVGSKAWDEASKFLVEKTFELEHSDKPIIIGDKELKQLPYLQVVPSEHKGQVTICRAGIVSEIHIEAIIRSIAEHSKANALRLYDENLDESKVVNLIKKLEKIRLGDDEINQLAVDKLLPEIDLKKAPDMEVAEAFIKWHERALRYDEDTYTSYQYTGKAWVVIAHRALRQSVKDFYKEHGLGVSKNKVNNVAEMVELEFQPMPKESRQYIAFDNGVLNKLTGEFMTHEESLGVRGFNNFSLETNSKETPHFDKWLSFVAHGDKAREDAILAGLYMVLTNRSEWHLFLEVTGVAGAGKSIMGEIAMMLNGADNTAVIDIAMLDREDRLSPILGATLIYSPDQKPYIGSASGLKRITGGDPVTVRMLYKDSIDYRPSVVFMMVTNNTMHFKDNQGGLLRRRVIINFNRAVPLEDKDPYFMDKICGELYGITNKLLDRFNKAPEEAKDILETYKAHSDGMRIKANGNHISDFASHFEVKKVGKYDDQQMRFKKIKGLRWGSAISKRGQLCAIYEAYDFYCMCYGIVNRLSVRALKASLPDALRETGSCGEIEERSLGGSKITNIYWRGNAVDITNEWKG